MDIIEELYTCFDNVGILIDKQEKDFDFDEYGIDSIQFITLVVEIEDKFNIVFPDELLLQDNMFTFSTLVNIVQKFYEGTIDCDYSKA